MPSTYHYLGDDRMLRSVVDILTVSVPSTYHCLGDDSVLRSVVDVLTAFSAEHQSLLGRL